MTYAIVCQSVIQILVDSCYFDMYKFLVHFNVNYHQGEKSPSIISFIVSSFKDEMRDFHALFPPNSS